jgi:hypothetical protein
MPLEFEWDESQLLSAKADSLRVKGTEAQRHRVFETHYFFFVPACACPHADRLLSLCPFVP